MKKIYILAAMALSIISCQKSDIEPQTEIESRQVSVIASTSASDSTSTSSKVYVDEEWGVYWSSNEQLGGWCSDDENATILTKFSAKNDGGEDKVEFNGEIAGNKLRLVHPYNPDAVIDDGKLSISLANQIVDIATPLSHLTQGMHMVSDELEVDENSSTEEFKLKHIGSILNLNINFEDILDGDIVEVTKISITGVPIEGTINLNSGIDATEALEDITSGTLSAEISNAESVEDGQILTVPLSLLPGEVTELKVMVTYYIGAKKYIVSKEATLDEALVIERGHYHNLTVNCNAEECSSQVYSLEGDGTLESPYLIGSSDDFSNFMYGLHLSSEDGSDHQYGNGLYFQQIASFNAPETEGAGTQGQYYKGVSFAGNYDGGGYTFTFTHIGDESDIGVFDVLYDGANISNLTIEASIYDAEDNVGTLAGQSSGSVELTNIIATGNIEDCNDNIGGIIGYATGKLTVSDCIIEDLILRGTDNVGGLVGYTDECTLIVDNFSNIGDDEDVYPFKITATSSNAGGLVGYLYGDNCSIKNVTIKNSVTINDKATKYISANKNGGGLLGTYYYSSNGTLQNISIETTVLTSETNGGGIIGYFSSCDNITLTNCKFTSYLEGGDCIGGFFGKLQTSDDIKISGLLNMIASQENSYTAIEGESNVGGLIGITVVSIIDIEKQITINTDVIGDTNVGGVIGYHEGDITQDFSNFTLDNDLTISGTTSVGGFIGNLYRGDVTGVFNEFYDLDYDSELPSADKFTSNFGGTVSGTSNVGGIIGSAIPASPYTISNFYFTGTVTGTNNIGGIIGYAERYVTVTSCINNAESLTNTGSNCGGVIGEFYTPELVDLKYIINYSSVSGNSCVGGVVGIINLDPSHEFDLSYAFNCGDVTGGSYTGGIAGEIANSNPTSYYTFTNLGNYGNITNTSSGNVGGIIGAMSDASDSSTNQGEHMTLASAINYGEVLGGGSTTYVGGVVGEVGYHGGAKVKYNYDIGYCCNRGKVYSTHSEAIVGGVVGFANEGSNMDGAKDWSIHDCYNTGALTSNHDEDTGGIVGHVRDNVHVDYCINIGKISYGKACVGEHSLAAAWYGDGLYYLEGSGEEWKSDSFKESEKKSESTFEDFDFSNIWAIDSDDSKNGGYPYLRNCPLQK